MAVNENKRRIPHKHRHQRKIRIRSAQPRRPSSNSRRLSNSRNERISHLPKYGERSPKGLAPIERIRKSNNRTGSQRSNSSKHSKLSNRSRSSRRQNEATKLNQLPRLNLRHNNYLI